MYFDHRAYRRNNKSAYPILSVKKKSLGEFTKPVIDEQEKGKRIRALKIRFRPKKGTYYF